MADYLLDCNHLSSALHKVSPMRERIHQARRMGHRFITCFPVLCELEVGIQQTAMPDENRRRLIQLLLQVRVWPLDHETTRRFGTTYIELKQHGFALSQVDIILAALARGGTALEMTIDVPLLHVLIKQCWIARNLCNSSTA